MGFAQPRYVTWACAQPNTGAKAALEITDCDGKMPKNNSQYAIIEYRRIAVANLRLRGMTIREIMDELPRLDPPIINERQGKPWSRGVIGNDLKALEAEWKEASQGDIAQHKANILAEIREARRAAWEEGRIDLVLRALEDERKMYGIDAPAKTDMNITAQDPIRFIRVVKPENAE